MEKQIKNARIEYTQLGYEDHNILTCFLGLDYGGSGQGFGGYALDTYDKENKSRKGTAYGLAFLKGILDTLEIKKWEDLVGTHLRADVSSNKVFGIGHILKDKWFYPEKDLGFMINAKEE